jgi:hypothetical protein
LSGAGEASTVIWAALAKALALPEEPLPLAWGDVAELAWVPSREKTLSFVGRRRGPVVIRAALAFFYPLVGCIVEGEQPGRPAIRCTADDVYFVEAEADCSLEDVRFLERPLLLPKEDLVPYPSACRARSGHASDAAQGRPGIRCSSSQI